MDEACKNRIHANKDKTQQIASQHGASNVVLVQSGTPGLPEEAQGDVVVVAAFRPDMTLNEQKQLAKELEELLDCAIYVISEGRLQPEAREQVRKEAIGL